MLYAYLVITVTTKMVSAENISFSRYIVYKENLVAVTISLVVTFFAVLQ